MPELPKKSSEKWDSSLTLLPGLPANNTLKLNKRLRALRRLYSLIRQAIYYIFYSIRIVERSWIKKPKKTKKPRERLSI